MKDKKIKKRILESPERWISYAEYIDLCLYHPEWGYYMTEGAKIGKEGDFYTVGSMHAVFAETLARWTSRLFARWGKPIVFCEMGAGTGRFARDFLEALQQAEPDMYAQTTYFIIEKSPRLITRQQEMLEQYAERVSWLPSVPSVRSTAGVNVNGEDKGEAGRYGGSSCLSSSFSSSVSSGLSSFEPALYTGVFFSNELVDAFPVHVVERFDGEWLEVGVTVEEQPADEKTAATTILREGYVPLEDQAVIEYLQRHRLYPQEGQRLEVPVAADQWAQTVSDWVGKGIWLTFDYGYTDRELFLPPHRQGSLRCYAAHRMDADVLSSPGEKDITSHIHFDALQRTAAKKGWQTAGLFEQTDFLLRAGIINLLEDTWSSDTSSNAVPSRAPDPFRHAASRKNRAIRQLISQDGISGYFRVLALYKEVPQDVLRMFEPFSFDRFTGLP